jgi:hypothetical protein
MEKSLGNIKGAVPARRRGVVGWQVWMPYAAGVWSLIYGLLEIYWAVSGRGFPYAPANAADESLGPLLGQFGPLAAWVVVSLAGIPAAALGAAMLRGVRRGALRPLFIALGALLFGSLLLLMTSLDLLVMLGYVPYILLHLFSGAAAVENYLAGLTQWTTIHQLLCLVGGFLWLGATLSYARRSGDACLYCGRGDDPQGWQEPEQAARWGRIAVIIAMVAPLFYAFTRYAWALGFPLGMTEAYLRQGQERGMWVSGLFLATFGLVGAALMLGLVQRWGELFPRWMVGLAGRRVPIALAVVPAALVSVLLVVGGGGIWTGLGQVADNLAALGYGRTQIVYELTFQVGPTLLFPLWGAALAAAVLAYYFRRRGPCQVCGRGGTS